MFVKSTSHIVDILTKAVSNKDFYSMIGKLGMIDIYTPICGRVLANKIVY